MIYTIYKATCSVNGKVYIGFDSNWPNRRKIHESSSKNSDNSCKFYRAIRKYGIEKFQWEVLYTSTDKEYTLNVMEPHFISEFDSFKNGYNSTVGGDGCFGLVLSEESKLRISQGNRIPKPQSKEHSENISKALKEYYRINGTRSCTEDTKKKISDANRNISKPMTEEHKLNLKCHINNSTLVSCPHCGKSGQLTNMKRWHFTNCKHQSHSEV